MKILGRILDTVVNLALLPVALLALLLIKLEYHDD
jgi:hypothetical protein